MMDGNAENPKRAASEPEIKNENRGYMFSERRIYILSYIYIEREG